uniref:Protein TsetseEP domain-containing protein n=1 Tax=Bactrocera latifrons TaxID=174628 RepID=A0A0K8U7B8_BACLA
MSKPSTMAQRVSSLKQLEPLSLSPSLLLILLWFANSCCNRVQALAVLSENVVGGGAGMPANDIVVGDVALLLTHVENDCFETFLQESRNGSNTYASAYRACQMLGSRKRLEFVSAECSTREDMVEQVTELCTNLCDCAQTVGDMEFFECSAQHSFRGVNTMQLVYLNSTAAIVELEHKYEEAEKQILLCIIAAEQQYVASSSKAFLKLSNCLKAT